MQRRQPAITGALILAVGASAWRRGGRDSPRCAPLGRSGRPGMGRARRDVHRGEVHGRMPVGDPVGEGPHPGTAGGLDAHRVEPGRHEAAVHLRRLPEVVDAIGGERLGSVEEQLYSAFAQRWNPVHRPRSKTGADVIPSPRRGCRTRKSRGMPSSFHTLALGLEEPDHQLAGLLLEVGVVARIAQYGRGRVEAFQGFGSPHRNARRPAGARSHPQWRPTGESRPRRRAPPSRFPRNPRSVSTPRTAPSADAQPGDGHPFDYAGTPASGPLWPMPWWCPPATCDRHGV